MLHTMFIIKIELKTMLRFCISLSIFIYFQFIITKIYFILIITAPFDIGWSRDVNSCETMICDTIVSQLFNGKMDEQKRLHKAD